MNETVAQIAVLIVFGAVLFGLNLKAGTTWLKFVTLWTGLASFGAAGYLIVEWVFL